MKAKASPKVHAVNKKQKKKEFQFKCYTSNAREAIYSPLVVAAVLFSRLFSRWLVGTAYMKCKRRRTIRTINKKEKTRRITIARFQPCNLRVISPARFHYAKLLLF